MGIYAKYVLPKLMHLACGTRSTMRQRKQVVPLATGRVLEIGAGSGLNLPFYDPRKIERLWALDPCPELWAIAKDKMRQAAFPIEFLAAHAERIPLADQSIDTIMITYSLCSIADVSAALAEMRRVLRDGGQLLFCEHGKAPDAAVRRWQRLLEPLWARLAGGCHLGRDMPAMLREGGFRVQQMNRKYISGWKPASFNYWGVATQARPRQAAEPRRLSLPCGAGERG